jgi:hypothetical protein
VNGSSHVLGCVIWELVPTINQLQIYHQGLLLLLSVLSGQGRGTVKMPRQDAVA